MSPNRSVEAGNATLLGLVVLATVSLVGVGLRQMQEQKLAAMTIQERRLAARQNNESAIELVAGLAADRVIVRDKNGLKLGTGAEAMAKKNGMWRIATRDTIEVLGCNPNMSLSDASSLFGVKRDSANTAADCGGRGTVATRVRVDGSGASDYVTVLATTSVKFKGESHASSYSARAQIRIPTIDEFIDNSGMCPFMEPVRTADGGILYYPDGKPNLKPRKGWSDSTVAAYNETLYGDPKAPAWRNLSSEMAKLQAQGYSGLVENEQTYDYQQTIPTEPEYHPPNSYAKFVHYLGGKAGGLPKWPSQGVREPRLKAGCAKSIGDSSPDFCTRVDVHVKDSQRAFTKKKDCVAGKDGTQSCETKTLKPPYVFDKREHWLCMYFSYHNVFDDKMCTRQFRAYCRNGDGCFDPETKLTMADGTQKPVREVVVGDYLWTAKGKPARVHSMVLGPELKPMWRIGFAGQTVKVTEEHPFAVKDGLKRAKDLVVGDLIRTEDGGFRSIEVKEQLPLDSEQMVWNIALEGDPADTLGHLVLSDGVVSGDLHLQNGGFPLEMTSATP